MRSERNGSSGKQSCSGGRARSCGGWMQRKGCGGARSYGSGSGGARSWGRGHEGVASVALKDVHTVVVQGFAAVAVEPGVSEWIAICESPPRAREKMNGESETGEWRTERLNRETFGETFSDGTQFQSPKSPKESHKLSFTCVQLIRQAFILSPVLSCDPEQCFSQRDSFSISIFSGYCSKACPTHYRTLVKKDIT
ncbi:hypothetical protein F2Q69_00043826 [Brassica cretica]|uniref:Uncharacterized protein n=1 Tax=Brassica cretica TaxID=69181 RepID=A0A8S9NA67_BRACR|nr:hypothetical protein F2Q69_00043826 [Brassica cretica]